MTDHPHWCDPQTCTAYAPPQLYALSRRHASREITVEHRLRLRLVQKPGLPPQMQLSTAKQRSTELLHVHAAEQLHEATAALLDLLPADDGPSRRMRPAGGRAAVPVIQR